MSRMSSLPWTKTQTGSHKDRCTSIHTHTHIYSVSDCKAVCVCVRLRVCDVHCNDIHWQVQAVTAQCQLLKRKYNQLHTQTHATVWMKKISPKAFTSCHWLQLTCRGSHISTRRQRAFWGKVWQKFSSEHLFIPDGTLHSSLALVF